MRTIIIPILPGRTEAYRRFLQELWGSHREIFEEWCAQCHLQNLKISIWENTNTALAIISFSDKNLNESCWQQIQYEFPFLRWLRKQLLVFHGVDLASIPVGNAPTLLLEY